MTTYNYTEAELSDKVDDLSVFSSDARDSILEGLTSIGVFKSASIAGDLARVETIPVGSTPDPGEGEEVILFTGDPAGPQTLSGADTSAIFASDSNIDVTINAFGKSFVATDSGDDTITSTGTSSDYIIVGDGDNSVDAGSGADTIVAGSGNDTLLGGAGTDSIVGGDGNNYIDGGNSSDTIVGGDGDDTIVGGDGNDSIFGGDGNNDISGGTGADTIIAGGGDNIIDGGNSADLIVVGGGNDSIIGGAGADTIRLLADNGSIGSDTVIGGSGSDTLFIDHFAADIAEFGTNGGVTTITFDNGDMVQYSDIQTVIFKT